jgi:hypothetical protein
MDQAAWRSADASLLLRQRMVGTHNSLDLGLPTGLGAVMSGAASAGDAELFDGPPEPKFSGPPNSASRPRPHQPLAASGAV